MGSKVHADDGGVVSLYLVFDPEKAHGRLEMDHKTMNDDDHCSSFKT